MWRHELLTVLIQHNLPTVIADIIVRFTLHQRLVFYAINPTISANPVIAESTAYIHNESWDNQITLPINNILHCDDTTLYTAMSRGVYSIHIPTQELKSLCELTTVQCCVNFNNDLYAFDTEAMINLHHNTVIPTPLFCNMSTVSIGKTLYVSSRQDYFNIHVYAYTDAWIQLPSLDPIYGAHQKTFLVNVNNELYAFNYHNDIVAVWKLNQEWRIVGAHLDRYQVMNVFALDDTIYIQGAVFIITFNIATAHWGTLDLPPTHTKLGVLNVVRCNV